MFKSNDSIKFYLFHIVVVAILIYCWLAVAQSYFHYAENNNGMTVAEHLTLIYKHGSVFQCFYDPLLTFSIPPLTLILYYSLKKKKHFLAHVTLIILLILIITEMDWYMIKEPTTKIFFFSYLRLLEYSLRVMMVFAFQGLLLYKMKKECNF